MPQQGSLPGFRSLFILLILSLAMGSAHGAITSVADFSSPSDPLYEEIVEKHQVKDKATREAIMKDMKAWQEDLNKKGVVKGDLDFLSADNRKVLRGGHIISIDGNNLSTDEVETDVWIAPYPRQVGDDIILDAAIRVEYDIPIYQVWELTLGKSGSKWGIEKVLVRTAQEDYYKPKAIRFARHIVRDIVTFELDSARAILKDGEVYVGYLYMDQPNQLPVCLYFEGDGTFEMSPPTRSEAQQVRFHLRQEKDDVDDKFSTMYLTRSPKAMTKLLEDLDLTEDRDLAKERQVRSTMAEFLKYDYQTDEEYMNQEFDLLTHSEDIHLEYLTKGSKMGAEAKASRGHRYYTYSDDRVDSSGMFRQEVHFGYISEVEDVYSARGRHRIVLALDKAPERTWMELDNNDKEQRQKMIENRITLARENKEKIDIVKQKVRCVVGLDRNSLRATTAVTFKALDNNVEEVNLNLAYFMDEVEFMADEFGRALNPTNDRRTTLNFARSVAVPLYPPIQKGQERTIHMVYGGEIIETGLGGLKSIGYGWIPDYGYLSSMQTDFLIGVPDPDVIVCVGDLKAEFTEGPYRYNHWKETSEIIIPNFTFADYQKVTRKAPNIITQSGEPLQLEAYASNRALSYISGGVSEGSFLSADNEGSIVGDAEYWARVKDYWGGRVQSLGTSTIIDTYLDEMENNVNFFTKMFGPYPYNKAAVAQFNYFSGYGQGWPSVLILLGGAMMSPESRRQLFGDSFDRGTFLSTFLAHEVSHQWWGHVVPWVHPRDQWLSEAFAQISCGMYVQSRIGVQEYKYTLQEWQEQGKYADRYGAIALGAPRQGRAYFPLVYQKGGAVMHNFRMMLPQTKQEDGTEVEGELFTTLLKRFCDYCRINGQKDPSLKASTGVEFQVLVERTLGEENLQQWYGKPNLDWWFDQWIYGYGRPKYVIQPQIENQGRGKKATGKVRLTLVQEQEEDNFFYTPVNFSIFFKDGTKQIVREITEAEKKQVFEWEFDKPVLKVVMDEFNQIFCDKRYV